MHLRHAWVLTALGLGIACVRVAVDPETAILGRWNDNEGDRQAALFFDRRGQVLLIEMNLGPDGSERNRILSGNWRYRDGQYELRIENLVLWAHLEGGDTLVVLDHEGVQWRCARGPQ